MNAGMSLAGEQVAILCGGRGRRLGKRGESVPKALAPLNERPVVDYVVDFYKSKGLTHFVFCVGYKSDQIVSHFENRPKDLTIQFSDLGESASMLQRIWALKDLVADRLIVSYCDTFIDLDLAAMREQHERRNAAVTIVTTEIRSPFGLVTTDKDGWAESFVEKPLLNYYIGCLIISKHAFDLVTPEMLEKPDGQGLVEFFCLLTQQRRLSAFEHAGTQITFNTESERLRAERDLGQFYTYREEE